MSQSLCRIIIAFTLLISLSGCNSIHSAARKGDLKTIKLAYETGQSLSSKNMFGMTPVLLAAKNHQKEALELLLELGAHDAGGDYQHKPLAEYVLDNFTLADLRQSKVKQLRDIAISEQAITSVDDITIGEFPSYNGSIAKSHNGYLFAHRTDYVSRNFRKPITELFLQELYLDFTPKTKPSALLCNSFCEDPRVFRNKAQETFVIFNTKQSGHVRFNAEPKIRKMFLSHVEQQDGHFYVKKTVPLESPTGHIRTEKNWTPF